MKEKLMEGDNYLVAKMLHEACGELIRICVMNGGENFYNQNHDTIRFGMLAYEEYVKRIERDDPFNLN